MGHSPDAQADEVATRGSATGYLECSLIIICIALVTAMALATAYYTKGGRA